MPVVLAESHIISLTIPDNRHRPHLTESSTMPTLTVETLDQKLQDKGQFSIDEFYQRACELAEQRSPAGYLSSHLATWEENNYDRVMLRREIYPTLTSLRRSLAQQTYRCDGNLEHLQRTHEAITNGVAEQHVLDTIEAHHLVKWCEIFCEVTEEVTTD